VCCCGGAGVRRGVGCEVRCVVVEVLESIEESGVRSGVLLWRCWSPSRSRV